MARLNLLLLVLLTVCALGLVTSQHKARKLFADLEREQARAKALNVEAGQLDRLARLQTLPKGKSNDTVLDDVAQGVENA